MPFRFCRPVVVILIFIILHPHYGKSAEIHKENEEDEQYKPRRWSTVGNGPYSMVVSADDSPELQPEESVAFLVSLQDKKISKNKTPEDKESEEVTRLELGEKYDKVTQRALLKRNRKRERYTLEAGNNRKRRRNHSSHPTTGLPHTMSYNLYNHFRPLEQDVPQDAILPFLDFGRKLSKGTPTTSGINSIEGSSTPRGEPIGSTEEIEDEENLFHEDMDVTVTKKAIERNAAPRGPVQQRQSLFTAYFKKSLNESTTTENPSTIPIGASSIVKNDNKSDSSIKNNSSESQFDLQSNESGIKEHAVLSPNYGLKLSKSEPSIISETRNNSEIMDHLVNETKSKVDYGLKLNKSEHSNITETQKNAKFLDHLVNDTASKVTTHNSMLITEQKNNKTSLPSANPTARILSTAVVTSVSVKESLRYPRIRSNYSSYLENPYRYNGTLKTDILLSNTNATYSNETHQNENKTYRTDLNYFNNNRRKLYTTLKPKTTTYRPVTFRSTFRRNGSYVAAVVHVVSTPPSYIEVPKIVTHKPHFILNRTSPKQLEMLKLTVASTTADLALSTSTKANSVEDVTVPSEMKTPRSTVSVPKSITSSLTTLFSSSNLFSTTAQDGLELSSSISTHPQTLPSSTLIDDTARQTEIPSIQHSTLDELITTPLSVHLTTTTEISVSPQNIAKFQPNTIMTTRAPATSTSTDPATLQPEMMVTSVPEVSSEQHNTEAIYTNKSTESSLQFTEPSTSVEIEFKTLDEHPVHTSKEIEEIISLNTKSVTEVKKYNATAKSDLAWIYNQRNGSVVRTQPVAGVDVVYQDSAFGMATYIMAGLGVIPLLIGIFILVRQLFLKSKKKVLDESEYSSEYNRSPLPTKLPRLPAHINWEENKSTPPAIIQPTKWEFPRDKLRLQTVLGQGNFGQVWKAEADDICDHEGLTRLVAVKTVKEGASSREKEDLLRELGIMQELGAHPNVVTLLGCCTDKEPYLLIMEYVMYGKLLAFLREHRTRAHYFNFSDLSSALTSRDLTVFAYCVARGMEYLVSKGIIHRDLAARNILVDHNKLCKIADFGMSRNVRDTGQIYEQRPNRGALPIRWMAPESLHFSLFTHSSDVWSFGILLWEIITLGSTPYNTMGAREVMRKVREGYRLEKPKHCKSEFYKVVTKCWHSDPTKRPSFTELKQDIGTLLSDKDTEGGFVDLEALAEEMCDQGH